MYLERLEIANFLGYDSAEFPLAPQGLVLVIGPNNTGKSALLSAMDVVADTARGGDWRQIGATVPAKVAATFVPDDLDEVSAILGADSHAGWAEAVHTVRLEWQDLDGQEMILCRVSIDSAGREDQTITEAVGGAAGMSVDAISREGVFLRSPEEAMWGLTTVRSGTGQFDALTDATSVLPGINQRLIAWREKYFHFAPVRTGSSGRGQLQRIDARLNPTGANLAQALLFQQSRNSKAWHEIRATLDAIIGDAGDPQARVGGEEIEVVLQDGATGAALNLKRLGTGVEQVLMLSYVGATQPAGSVVLMEEPESGLHPGAQRRLLEHLLEWAQTRLLVVATHSTVFLDNKDPDRTTTYLVSRTDGVASLRAAVDPGAEALDLVGVRLSDVASAERILLVEGESDVDILDAWFRASLRQQGIAVVAMRGGDKAWHMDTVVHVLEHTDSLDRRVVFLRDRDELSEASIANLLRSGNVHLLARRELENYLLDAEAIARVLGDVTAEAAQEMLLAAAEATRSQVLLKSVVARLPPVRPLDRSRVRDLCARSAGVEDLVRATLEATAPARLEQRVREEWAAAETRLETCWSDRILELAPGDEILSGVWKARGRRYDKRRDGRRIANAMAQPPEELRVLVATLAAR